MIALDVAEDGGLLRAADIFNGYIGANVAFALHELGLLSELAAGGHDVAELAGRIGADTTLLATLLETARRLGLVERDGSGRFALAAQAADLVELQGFITWVVGGYASLLRQLAPMARNESRFGVDVFRDEGLVAIGSAEADAALMAPVLELVFEDIAGSRVADIGCGGAARLIRLCRRHPGLTAVGIDISEAACLLARDAVSSAGMQERISIVCKDVLSVADDPMVARAVAEVDVVTSFFMLHDLFARYPTPTGALHVLREAFPAATTFLLADTMRSESGRPIFSLGYELVHAFMGIPLHTRDGYERSFAEAGLRIERCVPFGAPHSWLYVLCA